MYFRNFTEREGDMKKNKTIALSVFVPPLILFQITMFVWYLKWIIPAFEKIKIVMKM